MPPKYGSVVMAIKSVDIRRVGVWYVIKSKIIFHYFGEKVNWERYVDLGYVREGQDVRYSLNDDKLRALGWAPQRDFNVEIKNIVEHYSNSFYW